MKPELKMQKVINKTVDEFIKKYEINCQNELASLAFFHLFFFDMLSDSLKDFNIKLERRTIISNHIVKAQSLNSQIIIEP